MIKETDIIIVGGGMVGLVLALALVKNNFRVIVVENKTPSLDFVAEQPIARVSAINLNAIRILQNVGLWEKLSVVTKSSLQRLVVWDGIGAGRIEFDAKDLGVQQLGSIVQNREVIKQAWQLLLQHEYCEILCDHPVLFSQQNDKVQLELSEGIVLRAHLCVGADGANSWVREQMHITLRERSYQQHAIIAVVTTQMSHQHTGWQAFLPTGPLAVLPLSDVHQCAIVWSNTQARAQALLAMSNNEFECELNNAFGLPLGEIKFHRDRQSFPLAMRHAEKYVQGNLVLVGDAAHTIHPLAGQGVNLGFLDAACLFDCLWQAKQKNQPIAAQKILRRYERWRKGDTAEMILTMRLLNDLFSSESAFTVQLRSLGFNAVDRLTPLKKCFMHFATDKKSDLPSLASELRQHCNRGSELGS
ncbi:MAG: hypothetical protein A3F10_03220 [Coxiella sp. RIFCSPHIGHO2_12_FULL_42_15]|nr:MAG: hypothetical protein A3F10_03220 [Coxiella sp. RIFCSPHIGHO2_12_FULL_42_15]